MKSLFVKWTARALSIVSVFLILLFSIGEIANLFKFPPDERMLFLFFPLGVIVGFMISWNWEEFGSVISLLSFVAFYGANYFNYQTFPQGFYFFIFFSPALFFAAYSILHNIERRKQLPKHIP